MLQAKIKLSGTLIFIIFVLTVNIAAASDVSDLKIEILHVDSFDLPNTGGWGTPIVFYLTIKLTNPTQSSIIITHPDTCGFKAIVTYHNSDNWEAISRASCYPSEVSESINPGEFNQSGTAWIIFKTQGIVRVPDGDYSLMLDLDGWPEVAKTVNLNFEIFNGEVTAQKQVNTQTSSQLFPIPIAPLTLVLSVLLVSGPLKIKIRNCSA